MSDEDRLFACEACGLVNEEAKKALREVNELLDELREEKGNWIKEVEKKDKKIYALMADSDKDLRHSRHYKVAMMILERWRQLCHPGAVELENQKRLGKVIARLAGGYTKAMLDEAVTGYSRFPYIGARGKRQVSGTPGQRYVDAELIFRDPQHVDQGIALAKEALTRENGILPSQLERLSWRRVREANRRLILAELEKRVGRKGEEVWGSNYQIFPCPVCRTSDWWPLRVTEANSEFSYIMKCDNCGLDETKFLRILEEERGK